MKIIAVLLALLLAGCASAPSSSTDVYRVMEPAATERPTRTPLPPTPDALAVAQVRRAALDVELAQARNTAEIAAITATAMIAEVRATETRLVEIKAENMTTIAITRTAEAHATRNRAAVIAATQGAQATGTAYAPILRRNEVVADWTPTLIGTIWMLVTIAGLVTAYGLMRVFANWYGYWNDRRELEAPADDEVVPEPVRETWPGGLALSMYDGAITLMQLRAMALRVVIGGESLTHNNFTPSERLLSEGNFAKVQGVLVKYGYATWDDPTHKGGISLTDDGQRYMRELAHETA